MLPTNTDITAQYISEIVQKFSNLKSDKRIIFDSGQTVATPIIKEILSRLSLNYELLTTNRGLNPLIEEGFKNICAEVVKDGADLGVLWDGDCDRVVFINRKGELIPQSYILGIIAKNYNKHYNFWINFFYLIFTTKFINIITYETHKCCFIIYLGIIISIFYFSEFFSQTSPF